MQNPYMGKRSDIKRNVSFEFFSVLGTKTLKLMEFTIHGDTKQKTKKNVSFQSF